VINIFNVPNHFVTDFVLSYVSIGDILRRKRQRQRHATVTIVLALATLGDAMQIEVNLIAKASKEGDIALQYRRRYRVQTSPM
jgi:hypothetical protein